MGRWSKLTSIFFKWVSTYHQLVYDVPDGEILRWNLEVNISIRISGEFVHGGPKRIWEWWNIFVTSSTYSPLCTVRVCGKKTRWWFPIFFFMFTPIWGRFPLWRAYFSSGLKPPTTRWCPASINVKWSPPGHHVTSHIFHVCLSGFFNYQTSPPHKLKQCDIYSNYQLGKKNNQHPPNLYIASTLPSHHHGRTSSWFGT